MIVLTATKRTDERLLERMENHYSKPKGFVGRNICYAVSVGDDYFGHIVAGSATRFLPGRHDYLGTTPEQLNSIVNNIFFNVAPVPHLGLCQQTQHPSRLHMKYPHLGLCQQTQHPSRLHMKYPHLGLCQ